MKILVTGATGQVGQELQRRLGNYDLVALDRQGLDLAQTDTIVPTVTALAPDVILNAAAYTAVDKAEQEPELALRINAAAPGALAQAAQQLGATLVHISTDYVFDGSQSHPYRESDTPAPLGSYGRSKLAGEEAVRAACERHVILRTAWVYGAHGGGNFVKTMVRLGREREAVRVVYDQIGSPTWAGDIARTLVQLIPHLGPDAYGTYHYTASGVASWYDLAVAVFAEARPRTALVLQRVQPIPTCEYPTPAQRPAYSVLGWEKIAALLGETPPHWRESLTTMMAELEL